MHSLNYLMTSLNHLMSSEYISKQGIFYRDFPKWAILILFGPFVLVSIVLFRRELWIFCNDYIALPLKIFKKKTHEKGKWQSKPDTEQSVALPSHLSAPFGDNKVQMDNNLPYSEYSIDEPAPAYYP